MKINHFLSLISLLFLFSCKSINYYQLYKTTPSEKSTIKEDKIVFENEHCKILYDLWSHGGNVGFQFYNKSDKNIYVNLEECFLILNGISNCYYKNRVFTNSTSAAIAASRGVMASKSVTGINNADLLQTNRIGVTNVFSASASSGYSVAFNEQKIICIPPKASNFIAEYSLTDKIYRNCDLYRFPLKKQIKSMAFKKSNSPFVFTNRISYSVGQSNSSMVFENEFFVSEITNYPASELTEMKFEEFCNVKSGVMKTYFKDVSPASFYLEYKKGLDQSKH
jgi:hypothetical protein